MREKVTRIDIIQPQENDALKDYIIVVTNLRYVRLVPLEPPGEYTRQTLEADPDQHPENF